MILQLDDARNIIELLELCEYDSEFRKLVEEELELLGVKRNLTKKTRELISKGVLASIGMSLNYEVEEKHTVEDTIVDDSHDTEGEVMKKLASEKLSESLQKLPLLESVIIQCRYGINRDSGMSYKDIGIEQKMSPQHVVGLEVDALKKLRRYMSDEPVVDDYTGAVALILAIAWGKDEDAS